MKNAFALLTGCVLLASTVISSPIAFPDDKDLMNDILSGECLPKDLVCRNHWNVKCCGTGAKMGLELGINIGMKAVKPEVKVTRGIAPEADDPTRVIEGILGGHGQGSTKLAIDAGVHKGMDTMTKLINKVPL
ncbi:unnamed protein product [Rhizoctonia solani]|uniref:Hydrophobin n=1 Tax=Rhizoctonia solani TaxID=456999 RepID=A0A8H3A5T5_9AGAM|nr:unnamed protein product [Rhizoctonia solani]